LRGLDQQELNTVFQVWVRRAQEVSEWETYQGSSTGGWASWSSIAADPRTMSNSGHRRLCSRPALGARPRLFLSWIILSWAVRLVWSFRYCQSTTKFWRHSGN
jgi:hypothetical protein